MSKKIIISISDISPYRIYEKYTAETIEVEDFDIIKNVKILVQMFADWSLSPQCLFNSNGIDYLSYFIVFEDIEGVRQDSYKFKKHIVDTLKEILKRNDFSVPYEEIIEIEIAFQKDDQRIAPVF